MVQFRHLLGLGILAGLALLASCTPTPRVDETRQATGVKVGEVTDTSAIVWMRVTEKAERRADGLVRRGRAGVGLPPELRPQVRAVRFRFRLTPRARPDRMKSTRDTLWNLNWYRLEAVRQTWEGVRHGSRCVSRAVITSTT